MFPTKNDIPKNARTEVAKLLNKSLATLLDLQLQTKQAHWNVKGPHFFSLHLLFDKIYVAVTGFVDLAAERAVQLGEVAKGTIKDIDAETVLPPYPESITSGFDHLEMMSNALSIASKEIRANIDKAEKLEDAGTTDLFTEISRGLDESLWFVEAHLQADK